MAGPGPPDGRAAGGAVRSAAVLERSRQAALQALMLDPLAAAVCSLEEIRQMFEEMWEAEQADLVASS